MKSITAMQEGNYQEQENTISYKNPETEETNYQMDGCDGVLKQ